MRLFIINEEYAATTVVLRVLRVILILNYILIFNSFFIRAYAYGHSYRNILPTN